MEEKIILIEVKKWLNLANIDLNVAKLLLENKYFSQSSYYSQQSSEKAVKSVLILLGEQIYEHKIASDFYEVIFSKYPYEYIEEIYFLLSELETHWLKSRYILRTRNDKLLDPLEIYTKTKALDLNKKSEKVLKLIRKFLKEEFDF